ncbi:MAG: 50S ribosomal protein L11 methyltransferase [Alicyclobacillus sp.]|nr:50S ribosomal protein L11 methyltransferase [Alicyclobacillus sp.]
MTSVRWWEVECVVHHEAAEAVSALLQDWPEVQGVAIEGATGGMAGRELYGDWFDDSLLRSEFATVRCYVPDYVDENSLRHRALQTLATVRSAGLQVDGSEHRVVIRAVEETDWENAWKEHFQPLPVGRGFVIVPKWEWPAYDPGDRLPIILEPGMAFGTGTHASTQLCLMEMQAIWPEMPPEPRVADIGSGSGVLAIAAARLGGAAARVAAVDVDPVAVQATRSNAELNGVALDVRRGGPDALPTGAFDLVLANLTLDIHREVAAQLAALAADGGVVVASGIVEDQEAEARDVFSRAGLHARRVRALDGWVALVLAKTGA